MLNVKKTLTKILDSLKPVTRENAFNWTGSYTAPCNGILVFKVARATNAGSVTFYVKDTTDGAYGCACLATSTISQGFQNTMTLVVLKGHTYETEYSAGAGAVDCRLYRIPSWGGGTA